MFSTVKELLKDLNANGGNLSGVYKITRITDGKVYIGQSENISKRIEQHINNIKENNSEKIDGAIQKDGWQNFTYEIILALPELNSEQLWLAESVNITKYDSFNNGFNKTNGNHIGKYNHETFVKKNVVSANLTKLIRDNFKLDFNNKKILLINMFDEKFIDALLYHDCEVVNIKKYSIDKDEIGNYILEELDKYMGIKFDLIISNPPYNKIGANITKKIIDTIDFDDYINLLPANDYFRNDGGDLYKYVNLSSMTSVKNGFNDSSVTTYIARINKKPCLYISAEAFSIETYIDKSLKKYFYENINKRYYAIDNLISDMSKAKNTFFDNKLTFIIAWRDCGHKHFNYDTKCSAYKWNVEKSIDINYLYANHKANNSGLIEFTQSTFKTEKEKDNFTKFIYSDDGFRFISKVFTAQNKDGARSFDLKSAFPNVDWTRSWTVKEILVEYGYTDSEIKEVMDDLVNFKYFS